jgi:NAD-dependent DNA ligase
VCGGKLEILESKDGVKNLFCVNESCPSRFNETVTNFLERLGVMNVSNATLENWGIKTVADVVGFKPSAAYKSEVNFSDELDKKLWNAPKRTIFIALSAFVYGTGRRVMEAFWDKFGGGAFLKDGWVNTVESNPSVKEKLVLDALDNLRGMWKLIGEDPRYKGVDEPVAPKTESSKGSICFTGKLETMTRSVAQEKARKLGYEIAESVAKGLGTLVVADAGLKGEPSSKLKKAMKLNIKIMSESEFNAL